MGQSISPRYGNMDALGLGGDSQRVPITTGSVQSAAFPNSTYLRLVATVQCHVHTGSDPVALQDSMYLGADQPEYFVISAGKKIAVIAHNDPEIVGKEGVLYVTEAGEI